MIYQFHLLKNLKLLAKFDHLACDVFDLEVLSIELFKTI